MTSGLGGMSGAQAKAAVICGCVGVVAEASVATVTRDVAELLYKSIQILRTKNKFCGLTALTKIILQNSKIL